MSDVEVGVDLIGPGFFGWRRALLPGSLPRSRATPGWAGGTWLGHRPLSGNSARRHRCWPGAETLSGSNHRGLWHGGVIM